MMTLIPREQLFDRWDTLSDTLREAIASETNSDIAWKAGEVEHLPKEKIAVVSRLTGYVLMGFLHPEDTAKEIQDALGINPQIATSIANTLNSRIFNPLRNDLEKIYAPAIEEPKTGEPRIVEEIKKPAIPPVPAGLASVVPKPGTRGVPVPPAGGPKIISKEAVAAGQETGIPKPAAASPLTAFGTSRIESPPVQVSGMPPPFMLHQESEFAPIRPVSGFKLEIPEQEFRETKPGPGIPPRPAQIEIGSAPPAPPRQGSSMSQKPAMPVPRVVHYSESRTPLAPAPPGPGTSGAKQETRMPMPQAPRQETGILKPPAPSILPAAGSAEPFRASPPANLPALQQERKPSGILGRIQEKISPVKRFLPDPLKEPELPAG